MGFRPEYLIPLLLLALLFFGAKRLPEIGSAAGQTIREFQKAFREKDTEEPTALPPAHEKDSAPQ